MTRIYLVAALSLLATPLLAPQVLAQENTPQERLANLIVPHFIEEAKTAGMVQSYKGGWEYFVGGGGTSLDCNGDGLPDVVLAGGTDPAGLYINKSKIGGALSFQKSDLGLSDKHTRSIIGAYALDIDSDAHDDLILLRQGENIILRGKGNCTFEQANRLWNIEGGHEWTTAFAARWEQDQKFPTLVFGNYVDRAAPGTPWGTCSDNYLMRSTSGEHPDYTNPTVLSPGFCTLSVMFTDWNRSGEPALRVTNDRQYYRGGEEQLWRVEPGKPPRAYRRSDGWQHLKIWGMGIAEVDLNSDGLPEYALTSMGDTKLQSLGDPTDPSTPQYTDIAFEKGATAHRPYMGTDKHPSTGWHSEFADFNNDGRQDLYIAKGNVEAMADFAMFDPDNLLLQTTDGKFVEGGEQAGIGLDTRGRGAIIDDFNKDGMLDLLVVNRETNVSLFRNMGRQTEWGHASMGNWVDIDLEDSGPNKNGVGARLIVKTGTISLNRTISIGGGHAAGSLGPEHIGLGLLDRATVRVQWPDGTWSHDYRFLANKHIIIRRDQDTVIYKELSSAQ